MTVAAVKTPLVVAPASPSASADWQKRTRQFLGMLRPRKPHHLTKALSGDGDHLGWLIHEGRENGPVVKRYGRGDEALREAIIALNLLRVGPPPGFIEPDELALLKFLGPEGGRFWTEWHNSKVMGPGKPAVPRCLLKGWIYINPHASNGHMSTYRLTEDGLKVAERFFPEGKRPWW